MQHRPANVRLNVIGKIRVRRPAPNLWTWCIISHGGFIVSTVGKDSVCKDRAFALSCYFSLLKAASSACSWAIRSVKSSSFAFCLRATFEPLANDLCKAASLEPNFCTESIMVVCSSLPLSLNHWKNRGTLCVWLNSLTAARTHSVCKLQ